MKDPQLVLESFPIEPPVTIKTLGSGRVHQSFLVETIKESYVLQHVGPFFVDTAEDIDAVTAHLAHKHILTPQLHKTRTGSLYLKDDDSAWRLMTFIPGTTFEKVPAPSCAVEGASFVARFHTALLDYEKPFAYRIPGYRDARTNIARLYDVSQEYRMSSKHTVCNPIAEDIRTRAMRHAHTIAVLPSRVCHGDLKLNNLRFDTTETRAIALIDLDTIGRYSLPLELGDMLRSWCRSESNSLDIELWCTLMSAYRKAAHFLTDEEWRLIPDGFVEITLSLAARYLTDAYEERWFKHDPSYSSLYEQNVARSRMQLALLDSFTLHKERLQTMHS